MSTLAEMGKNAKAASRQVGLLSSREKDAALLAIAQALEKNVPLILEANGEDVRRARENGMTAAFLDRLTLDEGRIASLAGAVRHVVSLEDPVGRVLEGRILPSGLMMEKVSVPLGVVGIIYEARPNVTVDAAVLCLKSGNCAILRGGKEAFSTNAVLMDVMRGALESRGILPGCMDLVRDTSRETAREMMRMNDCLDVLIPRGGAGLIRSVVENATVPVIETGVGNCHIYVDESADLDMAVEILFNAKTSRPSVCNAAESLLVHQSVARRFLPAAKARLDEKNVQWRGCPRTREILGPSVLEASEEDYAAEFLDYILSARVVDHLQEAMDHIDRYGTKHSECIVTRDYESARVFQRGVDAAAVYVNASTRFTDGGEFGLGAEIGISTQKLHARGPMGLRELTTVKYLVSGQGQVR